MEPSTTDTSQAPVQQLPQPPMVPITPAPLTPQASNEGEKSYIEAFVLSLFVGSLGVDRFYLGYIGTGILKLLTGGGLGIWTLIDFIRIAFNKMKAKDGTALAGYEKHKKTALTIFTVVILLEIAAVVVSGSLIVRSYYSAGHTVDQTKTSITVNTASQSGAQARWTYTANEGAAAEKFIQRYNNAAFSRNTCFGESVEMYDVHQKDYQTVVRYKCGQAQVGKIAVFEQSHDSPDDWELKVSNMDDTKLPSWVYDRDAGFYATSYGVTRE